MGKNTGRGSRKGAVGGRFQMLNPITGLWAIFSSTGEFLRIKKSPGKAKGIRVGPPKHRRR